MEHITLHTLYKKVTDIQFVRFLFIGAVNTVFGYALWAFLLAIGLHYVAACFFGTVLGILFNFNTTGRIVFHSKDNRLLLRFLAVYAGMYVWNTCVCFVFDTLGCNLYVVGLLFLLPNAMMSYLLMKRFVFKQA